MKPEEYKESRKKEAKRERKERRKRTKEEGERKKGGRAGRRKEGREKMKEKKLPFNPASLCPLRCSGIGSWSGVRVELWVHALETIISCLALSSCRSVLQAVLFNVPQGESKCLPSLQLRLFIVSTPGFYRDHRFRWILGHHQQDWWLSVSSAMLILVDIFPWIWNKDLDVVMCVCVCVCVCVHAQSCLTLYNPMDCSPPGYSVHGIFQARILEWVTISSSWEFGFSQLYCQYIFFNWFWKTYWDLVKKVFSKIKDIN